MAVQQRAAELPNGIFAGLNELRHLYLNRNRLTELPDGLLSGLSRLETFAVAGNQLTRAHPICSPGSPASKVCG